jgi:hypothetical protein
MELVPHSQDANVSDVTRERAVRLVPGRAPRMGRVTRWLVRVTPGAS